MEKTCSHCGEPTLGRGAKGYCGKCYQRWRKYGDASDSVLQYHPRKGMMCTNCGAPVTPSSARGYCDRCYQRWRAHGDPNIVLPRSLPPVNRIHTLNHKYFDDVSTPEQAYWLGFITADGAVIRNSKTFALRLELAERDAAHVQAFADALGASTPPRHSRTCVYVVLHSLQLVDSLGRLGIGPRKSATVEPWDGPADLMPHYWRGLFDGDGCMCRSGGYWRTTLVGSVACVEAFAAWGGAICGSRATPIPTSPGSTCWRWAVDSTRMSRLLVQALYEDAPVVLRRKQQMAEAILSG